MLVVAQTRIEQQIANLCELVLENMQFRLVRVSYQARSNFAVRCLVANKLHNKKRLKSRDKCTDLIQLMIERCDRKPLDIEECVYVHRYLLTLLNIHDIIRHEYRIEISSPGLQRPLTRDSDLTYYKNNTVIIYLLQPQQGKKRVKGKIISVINKSIYLQQDNKEIITLLISNINAAHLY